MSLSMVHTLAGVVCLFAVFGTAAEHAHKNNNNLDVSDAHVFWSSDTVKKVDASNMCVLPCVWSAVDELGRFVAKGEVGVDHMVDLSATKVFGVGFYRIGFITPSNASNTTTVAILRPSDASATHWPPQHTPVAVDTAQAWLQPCDLPTQTLVSKLAAAAGCGWTRDRLRWSDLEHTRGEHVAPSSTTCYDNATQAAKAAGIKVLEVFHQTPTWAVNTTTNTRDGCDGSVTTMPRDLRDVYAFTKWLTSHFVKTVDAYEPWNEGDIEVFGGQTTDQRDSYQKAALLGFKSNHATSTSPATSPATSKSPSPSPTTATTSTLTSTSRSLSPATSTPSTSTSPSASTSNPFVCNNVVALPGTNATVVITTNDGVAPYMQSYNIHAYVPVEEYLSTFANARAIVTHQRKQTNTHTTTPIWLTECGIHLTIATPAPWFDMSPESDLLQAAFMAPSFAASMFAGVSKHFFFVLSNYVEAPTQFGLLRYDHTPRPGYVALAAVGHFFANASIIGLLDTTTTTSASLSSSSPSSSSSTVLPTATTYALHARPGGGVDYKDVLVIYCADPQPPCDLPPVLLSTAIQQSAPMVFDFLGRQMGQNIPRNVTNTCIFVVLPAGTVAKLLPMIKPPLDTTTNTNTNANINTNTNTTTTTNTNVNVNTNTNTNANTTSNYNTNTNHDNNTNTAAATIVGTQPTPMYSTMVLQSAFPYGMINNEDDVHFVNGSGTAIVFYLYNFGDKNTSGSVSATTTGVHTSITPTSWIFSNTTPGGRTRFTAIITPPTACAAIDGSGGSVMLQGDFHEGDNVSGPMVLFKVAPNISTVAPKTEIAVVGAADADAWVHNVPRGATLNVTSTDDGACVEFTMLFGIGVTNAWAYPQLVFKTPPPSHMDGLRYTVKDLKTVPAIAKAPEYSALFLDSNGTVYADKTGTNPYGQTEQEITLMFKDTKWEHQGPQPADPSISSSDVHKLALGVNLAETGHTTQMTLCNLRWISFC